MMKISVIVPIYNVEKQLQRCLESILKQEESNLEIILVNDGSPDNSGEIAKNMQADILIKYYILRRKMEGYQMLEILALSRQQENI